VGVAVEKRPSHLANALDYSCRQFWIEKVESNSAVIAACPTQNRVYFLEIYLHSSRMLNILNSQKYVHRQFKPWRRHCAPMPPGIYGPPQ